MGEGSGRDSVEFLESGFGNSKEIEEVEEEKDIDRGKFVRKRAF